MQLEQQQSYRLFSSSIRSDETRKTYTLLLKKFIEYLGKAEVSIKKELQNIGK
jgi:hypothetical protein